MVLELKRAKEEIGQEDIREQQLEFRINALKEVLMEKIDQARALENEIKVIEAKRQALLEIGELINRELAKLLKDWKQDDRKEENRPSCA